MSASAVAVVNSNILFIRELGEYGNLPQNADQAAVKKSILQYIEKEKVMNEQISYQDIHRARNIAKRQIELADEAVGHACGLSAGRLRASGVSEWVLCELKKELKNFNMHTGTWRE